MSGQPGSVGRPPPRQGGHVRFALARQEPEPENVARWLQRGQGKVIASGGVAPACELMYVSVRCDMLFRDSNLRLSLSLSPRNTAQGQKILLQKFKELPAEERADLVYSQPTPYHRYVLAPRK